MPYLDDLRASLGPVAEGKSDEDLLGLVSRATGRPPVQVADEYGYDPGKGSMWGERWSASVDRYQAGLYEAGAGLAGAMGFQPVQRWLDQGRSDNAFQADVAAQRASGLGAVDRWSDVHGPGDFLNYAGGLAVQSAPYLGEALVGGAAGRAALGGVRGAMAGGTAASYPSAVGDILGNQREQAGATDFGSAAALGIPYAGMNMLGLEGAAMRASAFRSGIRALDNLSGVGGVAVRTAATMGRVGGVEGATETGQEALNQYGRMQVDPNATMTEPAALDRYKESFIGGAVLGGAVGGAAGGWRRSEGYRPTLEETGNLLDPSNPVTALPQGPTPPPPGSMPGVPLTGIAPEVMAPPAAPVEPNIVAGVDANATQAEVQRKVQERQAATAELAQLIGVEKPKGAQVNLYLEMRGLRGVPGGFSDQEFQDAVVKLGAGEYPAVRAAIKSRQGAIKGEKEIADGSGGAAAGVQSGGSGAGGSADAGAGVGSAGQLAGAPAPVAPLAPAAPGAASLPARSAAVQQPAGVGIQKAFDGIKGGGTTEQLYAGLFQALVDGKDTYAGVKDPVLSKARPFYVKGEITTPADLKALVESGYTRAPLTKAAPEGAAPKVTTKPKREIVKPAPVNTPEELKARIATLDARDKGILLDALGADEELNQVNKPLTLRELGKKHGVSHEGARKIIGRQGIGQAAISKFAGVDMDAFGSSRELAGDNATSDNMGFRETKSLAGSGIKDTGQTAASRRLEKEANALLKAAKTGEAPTTLDPAKAVPGSATERFLLKKQQEREAQKKAADEAIEKKRQEYAAKLKAEAEKVNKDLEEADDGNPRKVRLEQADFEGAEADWQSRRFEADGDAHWSDLTKEEQERYTANHRLLEAGKVGEDQIDAVLESINKDAKLRLERQAKEGPQVVGDGTQAKVAVTTKKKRTIVKPEGPAAVNDPQRQKELVREAIKRKHARMQGKEVAPREQIKVRPRLNKLLKDYSDGKITADDMAHEIDDIAEGLESKALDQRFKGGAERATGADYLRERLLQAKRRGDLSPETVEFAEWFVLQNPGLVDELGVSVRKGRDDGIGGRYSPVYRVITLFKGNSATDVAVHEVLHHLERMMPEATQSEIRTLWAKAVARAAKQAAKAGETKRVAYFERVLRATAEKSQRESELAMQMVTDGEVPFSDYAYLNPSEFWAVNMAADQEARFDARNSLWEKTKLWLKDALEWAKMVLGLNSRMPMIRALRSVMAGDGEFQSVSMLGKGEDFDAPERISDADSNQPPGGQSASANRGQARAGVQAPVQGRAASGQGANRGAVAGPNGVGNGGGQPPAGGASAGLGDLPPPPGKPAKLKGWIDSVVAGKWRAAPWLLGTLSTEQLAERFKDLPGTGGKMLRTFHEGMQRMAQRANSLMTESDKIKRQWEHLRSKHGDKADEQFMDFMVESTRRGIWGMHPLNTDPEAKFNPNRHLAKVKKLEDGTKVLEYDTATKTLHAQLARNWRALHPDHRAFFETLQADFKMKHEAKVEGFLQNIVAGYFPATSDATGPSRDLVQRASKVEKKDRAAFAQANAASKLERDTLRSLWSDIDALRSEFPKEMKGPYFPLMRFGRHIVSLKSQAFQEAEAKLVEASAALEDMLNSKDSQRLSDLEDHIAELKNQHAKAEGDAKAELSTKIVQAEVELKKLQEPIAAQRKLRNAARKALADMKAQEDHYVVEFYESLGEATARRDQLAQHYKDRDDIQVKYSLKDQYLREVDGVTPTFMKKVTENLAGEMPASERTRVEQTMRELYLQMLPETSAMKSQMKRKNVAGVRNDQGLRAYSASSVRDAWYISRLENREPVRAALNELRFNREDADTKLIGDELAMRVAQNWHFDDRQWMSAATNVTYLAYLGMSPAFLVTQVTQPWVISAPVMAARHGAQTAGQLWRGWRQAAQLMKLNKKADGTLNYTLDPEAGVKAKILTAGEAKMLRELMDSGRIDITITHDLGASAAGRSEGLLGKAVRMSSWPAQQAEILNRVSTALAAYRMETAGLAAGSTEYESAAAAGRAYADKIVAETHLNYAPENRARLMHPNSFGGWGRLMWQFRSYQQGMLYLTLKNLFDALKGDKEARRAIVYLAGTQLAVAGTSGLPIAFPAGLVATLLYKAFTEDDEEKDLKELYRQSIASVAGDTVADLVVKGAPAAFLGVDMSKRIGMGNIFNPVPYADDNKEGRDWVATYWMALAGGAPLGYLGNVAEGVKAANDGDFAKAFAWAVPWKVAADLARGGSQALRGMVDSRGNTVLHPEELGYEDAVLKMLGFPSAQVERTRELRNAFFTARENRSEGRAAVVREMVQARLKGEPVDMAALQDWNARHPDNRITYSDVLQQVKAKRAEQATMQRTGGVPVKKSDAALAREMGLQ